ncbi:MAG: PHP domain-containing protein [Actinobacteria bacterium]|nr:PHP domain-containing protein [Actinomycetota bacterium]
MVDLHTHSQASDGSDPPARIPQLAATAGCSAVALTDHDTLDGLAQAREAAQSCGVELISGCEISCEWKQGSMHVLVYFVDPGEGPLQDELAQLRLDRDRRNQALIGRLQALGLPISYTDVMEEAGGGLVGRPHFAAALVRSGVVGSIKDAFDLYLAKGRPGYVSKARLSPAKVASLATASGGVAVLAHPLSLGASDAELDQVIAELAASGISGLEAIYGRYSPAERAALAALARRHDLAVTGGSDYHGTFKPDLSVGVGTGDLEVPDSALDEIASRRP